MHQAAKINSRLMAEAKIDFEDTMCVTGLRCCRNYFEHTGGVCGRAVICQSLNTKEVLKTPRGCRHCAARDNTRLHAMAAMLPTQLKACEHDIAKHFNS
jgi:hypothetical protein